VLVGRGLGLELRHQSQNPLWRIVCDTVFWLSSSLLAFMFGVTLGNVVRGVPLGPDGYFRAPLFSLLNWYGVLIGVFGLVVLAGHGAAFLSAQASGPLTSRARAAARGLWWGKLALGAALVYPTYRVRNEMIAAFGDHPWRLVFPALAVAALAAEFGFQRVDRWLKAFFASSAFIVGLLSTMAAGLYPSILPARDGGFGLTVHNAASGEHALEVGLRWWSLGIVLAIGYFIVPYRFQFRRASRSGD